jgi:hypothetical protein
LRVLSRRGSRGNQAAQQRKEKSVGNQRIIIEGLGVSAIRHHQHRRSPSPLARAMMCCAAKADALA